MGNQLARQLEARIERRAGARPQQGHQGFVHEISSLVRGEPDAGLRRIAFFPEVDFDGPDQFLLHLLAQKIITAQGSGYRAPAALVEPRSLVPERVRISVQEPHALPCTLGCPRAAGDSRAGGGTLRPDRAPGVQKLPQIVSGWLFSWAFGLVSDSAKNNSGL